MRYAPRPLATSAQRCPTCKRPWDPGRHAGRVCYKCKRQILRGEKYRFDGSRVRHRDCDDPLSYPKGEP